MRLRHVGNKNDIAAVNVINADANTIPFGSPVFFDFNGTRDGRAVVDANSAAAAKQGLFAGILLQTLATGQAGEAIVFGMFEKVSVIRATRAATTDSFASQSAIAVGDVMGFVSGSAINGMSRAAAAASTNTPNFVIAGEVAASLASSAASDVTGSLSSLTMNSLYLKCFIRAM